MTETIEARYTYDIDPALRALKKLDKETDSRGDVTRTVMVEVDGLDNILDIDSEIDMLPDDVFVQVQVDDSEILRADNMVNAGFDDQFVEIHVEQSEIGDAESRLDRLESDTYNIDLEVDDPTQDLERNFSAFISGGFLPAIGVAAGAAIAAGLTEGLDIDAANDRLQAQLNLTEAQAERAGQVSGALFSDAYGESVTEVNDVLRGLVAEGLADFEAGSEDALTNIAGQTLSLADTFDQDVNEVIRATSAILNNDLAPSSEAALDLLTRGLQLAGPRAEDLLETFGEYSNQLATAGLTGEASLALIAAGLDGGARSTDGAADALKELFLRITEGEGPSEDALESLGLSVDALREGIAEGGPAATAAYQEVFAAISSLEDPTEAARIAQTVLGGTFEQVGLEGIAAMAAAETSIEGLEGAAATVDAQLNDNLRTTLEGIRRTITTGASALIFAGLQRAIEFLSPAFREIQGALRAFVISFQIADGDITSSGLAGWFERLGFIAALSVDFIREAFSTLAPFVINIISLIIGFFSGLDIGQIIGAFADAFGVISEAIADADLEKILENLTTAFEFLLEVLEPVYEFLIDLLAPAIEFAGDLIAGLVEIVTGVLAGDWQRAWEGARRIVSSALSLIRTTVVTVFSAISSLISAVDWGRVLATVWDGIKTGAQLAWDAIVALVPVAINAIGSFIAGIDWGRILETVWDGIKTGAQLAWDALLTIIPAALNAIGQLLASIDWGAVLETVWDGIKAAAQLAWDALVAIVPPALNAIGEFIANIDWGAVLETVLDGILIAAELAWDALVALVPPALNAIGGFLTSIDWGAILDGIWEGIKIAAELAWEGIKSVITGALTGTVDFITGLAGDFLAAGASIGQSLLDGLSGVFSAAGDIGTGLINGIINAINAGIQFINDSIPNSIPLPGLPDIDLPDNPLPTIPNLADGAYIPAVRGGFIARLAENRHGEVAMNEGAPYRRNVDLLSQFQGGQFMRRLVEEARAGGGTSVIEHHHHSSTELHVKQPPTSNASIWGKELLATMKNHSREQDKARGVAA